MPPHHATPHRFVAGTLQAAVLLGGLGLPVTPVANAGSGSGSADTGFQVTATVLKTCLVTAPPSLASAAADPGDASAFAGAVSFAVACTAGAHYSVDTSLGAAGLPPIGAADVDPRSARGTAPTAPDSRRITLTLSY